MRIKRVGVIPRAECEDEAILDRVKVELRNIRCIGGDSKPMTLSYRDFDPQFVEDETNGRIEKIKKENEELARLGKPLKNVPEFVSRLPLNR